METLVLPALLAAEVALAWRAILRFGYLPSPTLISFWIIGAQSVLWLVNAGVIHYAFLASYARGGITLHFLDTEFFFAALFVFIQVCHTRLPPLSKLTFSDIDTLRGSIAKSTLSNINIALLLIVGLSEVAFALRVNWSIAWSTSQYLALNNSVYIMSGLPGGQTALVLLPVAGILAASAAALNLAHNDRGWTIAFAILVLFPFLYEVGAHSRVGAVFPFVFIVTLRLLSSKPRWLLTAVSSSAVVIFILSALAGRATGSHGLSSIPNIPALLATSDASFLNTFLPNVFEGALSLAESKMVFASYPAIFKILSLMPTPSFLDGFDEIQRSYQVRLSIYAPLSGFVEAQNFGFVYFSVFCLLIFASIRIVFRVSRINRPMFMFANLFLFLGVYALSAYPVRNGMKFFWIADGVALIAFVADYYNKHGGWQNRWRREQERWRMARLRQLRRTHVGE
jgi:hypothetical protein